jgi:phage-related protein
MWVLRVFERPVAESDIAEFVKNIRSLDRKVRKKVLVALSGMEENAKLLAKELKMSIWDLETLNMLFGLYGKKGIVIA